MTVLACALLVITGPLDDIMLMGGLLSAYILCPRLHTVSRTGEQLLCYRVPKQ